MTNENFEVFTSLEWKEIKVNKILKAKTMKQFNEEWTMADKAFKAILCQTNLKSVEELEELDMETFDKINEVVDKIVKD